MTKKKGIPDETLSLLKARLELFSPRSAERRELIRSTADLYGVSRATIYRALNPNAKPRSLRRADCGKPRKTIRIELEELIVLVAALKVRTQNKKGRHMSTRKAIEILETSGVETPKGLVTAPLGLLNKSLVNRYLKTWGYDRSAMWGAPPSTRFQAKHSNDCWQFDITPSDLKEIEEPSFVDPERGAPKLFLFSVVDDRSGSIYQEYRSAYGEDAETALRFLYNAMSAKKVDGFHFQGIPKFIYMDNGPVYKSQLFKRVMNCLGVTVDSHMPKGSDGRRPTTRSKGKVERPFLTVKSDHEVLYHFNKPKEEPEANEWLMRYLTTYNNQPHRSESHTRLQDWLTNLPDEGYKEMCTWERFCSFAREPERRTVDKDARIRVDTASYLVPGDLIGKEVVLWWGLFDNELFIDDGDDHLGPFIPDGEPIPLHTYRRPKKSKREKRADKVHDLAKQIGVPVGYMTGEGVPPLLTQSTASGVPFPTFVQDTPDFADSVAAKRAIAEYLGRPVGGLAPEEKTFVAELLAQTLNRKEVIGKVKTYFARRRQKGDHRAN